ncbi:MAG: ATP-binding cassette domain-containing protein [Verrucomicrobia bacterium]|nr:ATP-binding cassette domain-containing protein [Verrucomicrobiota bacterium]
MKIENIEFRHHKEAPYFFKDLSFELGDGLIHQIHGKNGVGKSVLLHLINQKVKNAVLVNQQYDQALVGEFNFLENLQFATLGRFPSPFSRLKPSTHIFPLLEQLHIDFTVPVKHLSGGQRQILSLLMKLQRQTTFLLLDEPTSALDEENATMVFEFLKSLEGMTMLIVCHDQELIDKYLTGTKLNLVLTPDGQRILD